MSSNPQSDLLLPFCQLPAQPREDRLEHLMSTGDHQHMQELLKQES